MMPRKEVADRAKTLYDMLDWLVDTDDFDNIMCLHEWVNDNFEVDEYEVGQDAELENVVLTWK